MRIQRASHIRWPKKDKLWKPFALVCTKVYMYMRPFFTWWLPSESKDPIVPSIETNPWEMFSDLW